MQMYMILQYICMHMYRVIFVCKCILRYLYANIQSDICMQVYIQCAICMRIYSVIFVCKYTYSVIFVCKCISRYLYANIQCYICIHMYKISQHNNYYFLKMSR